jgi:hypothetical protein
MLEKIGPHDKAHDQLGGSWKKEARTAERIRLMMHQSGGADQCVRIVRKIKVAFRSAKVALALLSRSEGRH